MRTTAAVAAAVLGLFARTDAQAVACVGPSPFADVLASDTACTNIEWIKNRAITLGCGGALYCPADYVTRAQMALFMNRLADSVIQQPVSSNLVPGPLTLTSAATDNVICTAIVALVAWPRTLVVTQHATFKMVSAAGVIGTRALYTLDGNTNNWNVATPNEARASSDASTYGTTSNTVVIQVPAGAPVKLGIGTFSVSGSGAVAESRCHTVAAIQSRTGSSSPFDESDATPALQDPM